MIRFIVAIGELFYIIAVLTFARLVIFPLALVYFGAEAFIGRAIKGGYRIAFAFPKTCWTMWRWGKSDPCFNQRLVARRGFLGAAWTISAHTWETRRMVRKIMARRKAGKGD